MIAPPSCALFFFFNDTATTEIYTLSLHDALPIYFGSLRTHEFHLIESKLKPTGAEYTTLARFPFDEMERSEEHTSELQSHLNLVCRLLLEKKKIPNLKVHITTHQSTTYECPPTTE